MSQNNRKIVVITGASAGVGRAVAREFARQGARIGLIARGLDGLEAARTEVERLGQQCHGIRFFAGQADDGKRV